MAISLLKDPSSQLLKMYRPPSRGTLKTIPAYTLPDDAVQDSMNVTFQKGLLRSRAGLTSFDNIDLGDRVVGSFLTVDTTNTKYPLCSTPTKFYQYTGGGWVDKTGGVGLNGTATTQVRFSSLQLGTQVYTLYANGVNPLKVIAQSGYTLADISSAGTIPVCTDLCTAFSRFIGITPPYTVQWCDVINDTYLSFTNWPALNQAILADTEDSLVAIRSLGTLGLAVYKEGNIFVGFAQSGPNSQAFRFEHRGEYEGPCGVNAIVNFNGSHIYLTPTGRVGLFDGTQHLWIADGLWPFLQDDIDQAYAYRSFGVYNYKTSEITFWYPRIGDSGAIKGMIIIPAPFPLAGVESFSYFLGRSNFSCTNGLSVRTFQSTSVPLIFGNNNETFSIDHTSYNDKTTTFPCNFSTGLFRPQSQSTEDIYRPIFEVYATRGADRGVVNMASLTSQTLKDSGTSSINQVIDLTLDPVNEYVAFEDTGSFLGVKFSWDSTAKFEYKGCDVYGRATQ